MIIMNVEVTLTAPGWKEADLHGKSASTYKLTPGLNVQRSTFKTCQLPDLYPWLGTGSRRCINQMSKARNIDVDTTVGAVLGRTGSFSVLGFY